MNNKDMIERNKRIIVGYEARIIELQKRIKKLEEEELDPILKYVKEHPFKYEVYPKYYFTVSKDYILVPLPVANDAWTFKAFHWAEDFCKYFDNNWHNGHTYSAYPVHHHENDNEHFLYIYYKKH